ncbi:hypothetical protein D3C73_1266800 [compost metagenome]
MRFPQAHHRAGYAGSASADQAEVLDDLALLVQVHVAGRGFGRRFAVVEEVRLAVDEQGHETTATNVPRFRVGHRQGERGGHRGVDGVAAFLQHLRRDIGAVLVRCSHGTAFQHCSKRRRTGGNRRRQGQGLEQHNTHGIHPFLL